MSDDLAVEGTLAGAEAWNPALLPGLRHLGDAAPQRAVQVLNENHLMNLLDDAAAEGARVLPVGGGRGGPCVASSGSVALDMRRMSRVLAWDRESLLVRAEAGVTVGALSSWLESSGASLSSWRREHPDATVGGLLSAWQPSPHALWGGSAREACVGLSAVTGEGALYTYVPAPRKAAGPDLRYLFMGGDGAFGVIASAWLGVTREPEARRALRVRCPDHRAALRFLRLAFGAGLRCPNALYSGAAREAWLLLEGSADAVTAMDGLARRSAAQARVEARTMDPDAYYQPAQGDVRAGADPVSRRGEEASRARAVWGGLEALGELPEAAWEAGVLYDISAHQGALHVPSSSSLLGGVAGRAGWLGGGLEGAASPAAQRILALMKAKLDPRGVLPSLEGRWGAVGAGGGEG